MNAAAQLAVIAIISLAAAGGTYLDQGAARADCCAVIRRP